MISLTRGPSPAVLVQRAADWTTEVVAAHAAGDTSGPAWTRYRHDEIKAAVQRDTGSKCAYCESKMKHVDYGDIEHIRPKSVYPAETYAWNNLTVACGVCNTNKGDKYDETLPFVNPFQDDPDSHLQPDGAAVFAKLTSPRGELTSATLELNRTALLERRGEALAQLHRLMRQIAGEQNPSLRTALTGYLHDECSPSREFAMVKRATARRFGFQIP